MHEKIKKFLTKMCSVILLVTILVSVWFTETGLYQGMTINASAADTIVDSGVCGILNDNVKWTFYSNGDLIVYGSGNMDSYVINNKWVPWGKYKADIETIIIDDGVTSIGTFAFSNCSELKSIIIHNSVTSIGIYAFEDCVNLTNITIPDSVTSIGGYAFVDCARLSSIKIPDSVTEIGSGAFDNTAWYNSKNNGLVYAGKVAYKYKGEMPDNCSIILKDDTKGIAAKAFSDCTGLKNITITDNVVSIGDYAFENCIGLTSIKIGNSVKSIGKRTFYYCTELKNIILPDSITSIGEAAFWPCEKLEVVYYEGSPSEWSKVKVDYSNNVNYYFAIARKHFRKYNSNITFRTDTKEKKSLSHEFNYFDGDFEMPSTVFNQDLAIFTLGMVLSGFSAGNSDNLWTETSEVAEKARSKNINNAYTQFGFDTNDIQLYNYDVTLNDSSDKVAFSIAHKKIFINGKEETLVAVILRGGGYGAEWSSNFNLGSTGQYHNGFNAAALSVKNKIVLYLKKYGLTSNVKILMGGFSRSAAVANLTAAYLDNLTKNNGLYSVNRDDIYVYTFATPQGIIDNKSNDIHNSLYNNIFNIINPSDIVPTLALSKWKFGRYGVSLTLPYTYYSDIPNQNYDVSSFLRVRKITEAYNKIVGTKIDILPAFTVNKSSINDIDKSLYKLARNTDVFVNDKYQTVISKILKFVYTNNLFDDPSIENISSALKSIYGDNYKEILVHIYSATSINSIGNDIVCVLDALDNQSLDKYKLLVITILGIIDYETGNLDKFVGGVLENAPIITILKLVLFSRFEDIGSNHYPELYVAWLESYDVKELFGSRTYKKITASCPVNVDIYSGNGTLVASVVNNEIIKNTIPVYLENDSKEIWLIDDDEYDIVVTAYDNGTMTYSVEEYNQDFELQNKTNFYDVELKKGGKFKTSVTLKNDENMTLYDEEKGIFIFPSEVLTDSAQTSNIEVSVECDSNGYVYGTQMVIKGEYVSVLALPKEGYRLAGWFDDGELVSKCEEYYFTAVKNTNLVAKFIEISNETGDTNNDGEINIADALMISRYDAGMAELDESQLAVSDVTGDGEVNIADALMISRFDAGLIDSLVS